MTPTPPHPLRCIHEPVCMNPYARKSPCIIQVCPHRIPHITTQSERDRVLTKLHEWFENYCEGNEEPELWVAFINAERAFRTPTEAQR